MTEKPNPYYFQKELTMRAMQKIGDLDFEIEYVQGKEKAEVLVTEDGRLQLLADLEVHELEGVSKFFNRVFNEIIKLNTPEKTT